MLTFAAILVLQTEEIQKNRRLSDGYKTCPKRFDRVFETWLHVGIWIDATGINWSSWLWVTTSTLSTKGQGRSHWLWNLHYIQPFNSHWPKNFSWIAACVCEIMKQKTTLTLGINFTVFGTVIIPGKCQCLLHFTSPKAFISALCV